MDSIETTDRIEIEETLEKRLAALAGEGRSASDLANDVLRAYAEEVEEFAHVATAEDERRWQRYLETGEAISFDEIKTELKSLAARSASKAKA